MDGAAFSTVQQLGGALGVALLGTVFFSYLDEHCSRRRWSTSRRTRWARSQSHSFRFHRWLAVSLPPLRDDGRAAVLVAPARVPRDVRARDRLAVAAVRPDAGRELVAEPVQRRHRDRLVDQPPP